MLCKPCLGPKGSVRWSKWGHRISLTSVNLAEISFFHTWYPSIFQFCCLSPLVLPLFLKRKFKFRSPRDKGLHEPTMTPATPLVMSLCLLQPHQSTCFLDSSKRPAICPLKFRSSIISWLLDGFSGICTPTKALQTFTRSTYCFSNHDLILFTVLWASWEQTMFLHLWVPNKEWLLFN